MATDVAIFLSATYHVEYFAHKKPPTSPAAPREDEVGVK